jgi:hypothetical protein
MALLVSLSAAASKSQDQAAANHVTRRIGVIKAIDGSTITLAPDSGSNVTVAVQPSARILQLTSGDVKSATPIQLQDLHVGDRIRIRGFASDDATTVPALEVIVITQAVVAVSDQIRQDWRKRGMGGLVSAVDPAAGTITISITSFGGKKSILIRTSKTTIFRRYPPDSVKFEDAKASTLDQIHPGDQVRARGDRNADGTEFTAEEVVSGSFRNIAGTVISVDASAGTMNVQDLLTKKPVQVKVSADSQLHKIPAEMAQGIAMRLKGAMHPGSNGAGANGTASNGSGANGAPGNSASTSSGGQASQSWNQAKAPANGAAPAGAAGPGGAHSGGAPDFQQMLSRMPTVTLSDLHKGDAVMIVTAEGSSSAAGTVITLLSGVEPILEAAPNGSEAMMLAPWSLGGAPAGDASNP